MSKKRESTDTSHDEKTTEDSVSEALSQRDKNTKRARLASSSGTTVQDLPREMVECILVRAITMEVRSMKLAKSVWKEKADLAMSSLQTVCSQWNDILSNDFVRNEVHGILDGTAQETIRLEMIHRFSIDSYVFDVTTLRDEIFMLCRPDARKGYVINVYKRTNMTIELEDVIPMPGYLRPWEMTGCSVTNSLYALTYESDCSSVIRITKDEQHLFSISTWITDPQSKKTSISVSTNGNLVVVSQPEDRNLRALSIFDASAVLQHTITLSMDALYGSGYLHNILYKPNGNLAFVSIHPHSTKITEVDERGSIIGRFETGLHPHAAETLTDSQGRIWMTDFKSKIEVIDSELNLFDSTGPQLFDAESPYSNKLHYSIERNEIMRISGRSLSVFSLA